MAYEQWKVNSNKAKELYDKIYENSSILYMKDNTYADIMVALENAINSGEISKEEYEYLTNIVYKYCNENSMNLDADIQTHDQALKSARDRWKNKSSLWKFFHRKQKPSVELQKKTVEELNKLYS